MYRLQKMQDLSNETRLLIIYISIILHTYWILLKRNILVTYLVLLVIDAGSAVSSEAKAHRTFNAIYAFAWLFDPDYWLEIVLVLFHGYKASQYKNHLKLHKL